MDVNASVKPVSRFLKKHGLATLIVIGGVWYVSQVVVTPLTQSYRALAESVRVVNEFVTDEERLQALDDAAKAVRRLVPVLPRRPIDRLKELRGD